MRYGMFYGVGRKVEIDKYRLRIIENLPKDWDIFIFSNKWDSGLKVEHPNVKRMDLFNHPVFKKSLEQGQIEEQERWLGMPFGMFIKFNYAIDKPVKGKRLEDLRLIMAQMTIAYQDMFQKSGIEVYTCGGQPGFAENISLYVAKKMGIGVINPYSGRLRRTFSPVGFDFNPIWWRRPNEEQIEQGHEEIRQILFGKKDDALLDNKQVRKEIKSRYSTGIMTMLDKFREYKRTFVLLHPIEQKLWRTAEQQFYIYAWMKIRMHMNRFFVKKPDLEKKFYYFPLHYENDAQVTLREPFMDQLQLIKQIAMCLPSGTRLYVKPHPHYMYTDIEISRMQEFAKIPGVDLIDISVSSQKLIPASVAVITLNSTTGFEAVAMGHPLITMGHDLYALEDVSVVVRDMKLLPEAMVGVLKDRDYGVDREKIKRFLGIYYHNLVWLEEEFGVSRDIDFSQNDYRNIAESIVEASKVVQREYGFPFDEEK